jgi:hypothetical protein
MIVFLFLVVLGLLISQIYLFHLYKDKIKRFSNLKKDSIILEPIPKVVEVEDVDGVEELLKDILLSAKEESWGCEFLTNGLWSHDGYEMKISSPDGSIVINSVIRDYSSSLSSPRLLRFNVSTSSVPRLSIKSDKFENDILVFLWDFILDKHIKENSYKYEEFKNSITEIRKNLKSLNRNRILNELLK